MEKKYEYNFGDKINKIYKMEDRVDVLDFINTLQSNNVQILDVKLTEGVELEMQSVSGNGYKLDEFIKGYEYLRKMGDEMRYVLNCIYEDNSLIVTVGENSKAVTLTASVDSIELQDLVQKKNKQI